LNFTYVCIKALFKQGIGEE